MSLFSTSVFQLVSLSAFLATLDLGIRHWRASAPVSDAPVWSLPMAEGKWANTEGIRKAVEVYKADRGTELKLDGPEGEQLTVFYFEWDEVEVGPMMDIAGHRPEECNVVAGFKLVSHDPSRSFQSEDPTPLVFDATTFEDPGGKPVYMFKTAWFQGEGSREIREGENRRLRFRNSFERGSGAARVIEVGVMGVPDEDQAWQIFQSEVLGSLAWSQPDS